MIFMGHNQFCPNCHKLLTRHEPDKCGWAYLDDEDRWVSPEELKEFGLFYDPQQCND